MLTVDVVLGTATVHHAFLCIDWYPSHQKSFVLVTSSSFFNQFDFIAFDLKIVFTPFRLPWLVTWRF